MEEELAVAGSPVIGDSVMACADQSYLSGRARRLLDDARLHRRIANDTFLADFRASGLELRLHQRDDVGPFAQQRRHRGKMWRSEMNDTSMVTISTE